MICSSESRLLAELLAMPVVLIRSACSCLRGQQGREEPLLGNLNLQMAREEYGANGQQGLDELLSIFADEGLQVLGSVAPQMLR